MAPRGLIPFSYTFPGLAILLLSIGILPHDGVFILLSYLFPVVTVFYIDRIDGCGDCKYGSKHRT
jgi:hypothetical protein